jgi:hypothetical protein
MGGKERPGPPPISTFKKRKHLPSFLFVSILSPVLNDPCQAAHPVLEDTLNVIKMHQRVKTHIGLFLANRVGAEVGRHDALRISTSPWIRENLGGFMKKWDVLEIGVHIYECLDSFETSSYIYEEGMQIYNSQWAFIKLTHLYEWPY